MIKPRHFIRFALSILVSILLVPIAYCVDDSQFGNDGTPGTDGTFPSGSGGNGGPGQSVTADAGVTVPNSDTSNTTDAEAGFGGHGGAGAQGSSDSPNGGNGGNGGTGGDATASSATTGTGDDVVARSFARGGSGGAGGDGGFASSAGTEGIRGNGGNAGTANAQATAESISGSATVSARSFGGAGGDGTIGGAGGDAVADASGTSSTGSVDVIALVFAGDGGASDGIGNIGGPGAGTASSVHAVGNSTNGGFVTVDASLVSGSGGSGFNGASGGAGANASLTDAVAGSTTGNFFKLSQQAQAGNGGSGSGPGTAGFAGDAFSSLTLHHSGEKFVVATSTARGGQGAGSELDGSKGGNATAAVDLEDTGEIMVTAEAFGGPGGLISSSGAAGDGGSAFITHATGTSNGAVTVVATATGGDGGSNFGTGAAGNGASTHLTDVVSGSSPFGIRLEQRAFGGNGGAGSGGTAGSAGDASSHLTFNNDTSALVLNTEATGGVGGSNQGNAASAKGGNAISSFHGIGKELVFMNAFAFGGTGGASSGGVGGDGGTASIAPSFVGLTGTGDDRADGSVFAAGGNGGFGEVQGGKGADTQLIDAVSGSANGNILLLSQSASGGWGGSSSNTPGRGGDAISTLNASNPGTATLLTAFASASGGKGGDNVGFGDGASGGSARAEIVAVSSIDVNVGVGAFGGGGGNLMGPGTPGINGDATATATGTASRFVSVDASAEGLIGFFEGSGQNPSSAAGGTAIASATGTGESGDVTASAVSGHAGSVLTVVADAKASVPGTSSMAATSAAEARAQVNQPAPANSLTNGLQAATFVTAQPHVSDVAAAEAGNPNVAGTIGTGSNVLALVTFAQSYSANGSGASAVYESSVFFAIDQTLIATSPLAFGFVNPVVMGNGFTSLQLTIAREGNILETETFTSIGDALAFFDDHVLTFDLTGSSEGPDPIFLDVTLQLTTDTIGDGFRTEMIAAAVPEPATVSLIVFGLFGFFVLCRRCRTEVSIK